MGHAARLIIVTVLTFAIGIIYALIFISNTTYSHNIQVRSELNSLNETVIGRYQKSGQFPSNEEITSLAKERGLLEGYPNPNAKGTTIAGTFKYSIEDMTGNPLSAWEINNTQKGTTVCFRSSIEVLNFKFFKVETSPKTKLADKNKYHGYSPTSAQKGIKIETPPLCGISSRYRRRTDVPGDQYDEYVGEEFGLGNN